MKKAIFLLITLILITGCGNDVEVSYNDTEELPVVEDILVEDVPEPIAEEPVIEEPVEEEPVTETIVEELPVVEEVIAVAPEMPEIYKKCQYSAIAYGGCGWMNEQKTSFELTIGSGSPGTIPGLWFIIHGLNETKYLKKTDSLLKGSSRTYLIIYEDLVEELGMIAKFEVLSIEEIDGREVACQNQRVSFMPTNNCKLPIVAIRID